MANRAKDSRGETPPAKDPIGATIAAQLLDDELKSLDFAVSHDLRAPLRHILGFSDALSEHLGEELDPTAKMYLDCIVRAGRKMEGMIEGLLSMSRITRQEMQVAEVDLSTLARNCATLLKDAAPQRRVMFEIEDRLAVRGDAAMLKVAMKHLFDNAWKYTGKKKTAKISFGSREEGGVAAFYLSDNGAGFDMRYAGRLFTPFQRMHTESEFEGRGVGLATVQRIVHRHGGRIWLDARVDGGTTVFFTLSP